MALAAVMTNGPKRGGQASREDFQPRAMVGEAAGESSVLNFRRATYKQGQNSSSSRPDYHTAVGTGRDTPPFGSRFPTNRMNRLGLDQCFSNRWYNLMNSSQKNTHCI